MTVETPDTRNLSIPEPLPATMQAARFYTPGDVRIENIPLPQPGTGEVLVKIERALTCGTDLKCYRRGHPVLLANTPSPFGHEGCGRIAALGDGVSHFQVNQRVAFANSAPCGECFFCQKSQPNLCENITFLNGTYAEYILLSDNVVAKNTHAVDDSILPDVAAFTEPLAVALRGVLAMDIQPEDTLCLLGIGPIGLLMVAVAKSLGAHVTALGRSPLKRQLATQMGADTVIEWTDDITAETLQATTPGGYGFDHVIEAVGLPEKWQFAVDIVRKGGKVNLFGGCPGGSTVTFDTRRLHYDEVTLLSLFHHTPAHIAMAVDWLTTGKLDPRPLITDTMPLSDLTRGFEQLSAGQAVKFAIQP